VPTYFNRGASSKEYVGLQALVSSKATKKSDYVLFYMPPVLWLRFYYQVHQRHYSRKSVIRTHWDQGVFR